MKITPKPWRAEGATIVSEFNWIIAEVFGEGEEQQANAMAITKVPEMIELLAVTLSSLEDNSLGHAPLCEDIRKLLKEIEGDT